MKKAMIVALLVMLGGALVGQGAFTSRDQRVYFHSNPPTWTWYYAFVYDYGAHYMEGDTAGYKNYDTYLNVSLTYSSAAQYSKPHVGYLYDVTAGYYWDCLGMTMISM